MWPQRPTWPRHHVAFFPVSLSSLLQGHIMLRIRPNPESSHLWLMGTELQGPCFHISSHSEVVGGYEFGGWIQPRTAPRRDRQVAPAQPLQLMPPPPHTPHPHPPWNAPAMFL